MWDDRSVCLAVFSVWVGDLRCTCLPCKVVRGALCEPLSIGWLERGSGGPVQLHCPMSTGEDSLAKSLTFGTIKDVAVAPTTREYSAQQTL